MNTLRKLLWLSAFGFQLSALAQVIPTAATEPLTKTTATNDLLNGTFNLASGQTMTAKAGSTVNLSAATLTLPTSLTIPSQTGNANKFLYTNGTVLSWRDYLSAADGSTAVDYLNRSLTDATETVALDWNTRTLQGAWALGTPTSGTLTNATGLPIVAGTTGTLTETRGGTAQTSYALGDTLYASAANTLAKLSGNTSATMAVLTQTGNGTVSAAPVWTSTTGTGNVVRAISPTLTTPNIGAASATSLTFTETAISRFGTGNLQVTAPAATGNNFDLVRDAAQVGLFRVMTGASRRWAFGAEATAESGANAGSNWVLRSYDDSNVFLRDPITVNRATGAVTFSSATTSNSKDVGALVLTDGGLGVEGAGYFGGLLRSGAAANMFTSNAGAVYDANTMLTLRTNNGAAGRNILALVNDDTSTSQFTAAVFSAGGTSNAGTVNYYGPLYGTASLADSMVLTNGAASGITGLMSQGASGTIRFYRGSFGTEVGRFSTGNNLLLGTTTDSSNGRLQLASHTTSAGGIGFGTVNSIYNTTTSGLIEMLSTAATDTGFRVTGANGQNTYLAIQQQGGIAKLQIDGGTNNFKIYPSGSAPAITFASVSGNTAIGSITPSSSPITGAFTVAGGAGFDGALHADDIVRSYRPGVTSQYVEIAGQGISGQLDISGTGGDKSLSISNSSSSTTAANVIAFATGAGTATEVVRMQSTATKPAWGLAGVSLVVTGRTYTDSSTGAGATAATATFVAISRPTLAASNTSVTTTDAATVYIGNSPANGTNMTITNPWSLWVDDGNVRLDGRLLVSGTVNAIGNTLSTTTNLNLAASTTGVSSLRIPHGSAPSSPVDGDVWTTTTGLYVRVNGATVGPLN